MTCEVLEILPRLAPGVVVHVHDICFPREYPREYAMRLRRFWNEQYLLHAFLIHNERWRVLWSSSWLRFKHHDRLLAGFPSYRKMAHPGGGSFWMQRLR